MTTKRDPIDRYGTTHYYGDGCLDHPLPSDTLVGACVSHFPKCCNYHDGWLDGWLAALAQVDENETGGTRAR